MMVHDDRSSKMMVDDQGCEGDDDSDNGDDDDGANY